MSYFERRSSPRVRSGLQIHFLSSGYCARFQSSGWDEALETPVTMSKSDRVTSTMSDD
jgi:hypothetical protein